MSINSFEDYPLSWRPDKQKLKRPIYISLIDCMRQDIKAGNLLPGTKLPPQRELADFLDISFSTVTRAYKVSQDLGITYGRVGRGTYIAQNAGETTTITRNKVGPIQELGFISSFEMSNSLLRPTIRAVANQPHISDLLNYDAPTGLPRHKLAAIKYLKRIGVKSNLDNLVITSGGENALIIALMGLFHSGDKIAVDQFTYANLIELARLLNLKLVPVEADGEGMSAKNLWQICQSQAIKGLYLMPDACNPTTQVISNQRRSELAQVIKAHHLIMIEDDYLSFLNLYRQKPLDKISNLVPSQSIYICSMSKPLVSGLRVAFMCVAKSMRPKIEDAMFNISVKTSSLDVDIVIRALENGTAEKIMTQKVKMAIAENHFFDKLFFKTDAISRDKLLFFRFLPLNSPQKGKDVEQFFLRQGIRVFHSDRFLVGERGRTFLRISLASCRTLNDLYVALTSLKKELMRFQR